MQLRKAKGLTQSELAEILHVSDKAVSRWENGHGYPDVQMFPVIAELFGVTIEELCTGNKTILNTENDINHEIVKPISVDQIREIEQNVRSDVQKRVFLL